MSSACVTRGTIIMQYIADQANSPNNLLMPTHRKMITSKVELPAFHNSTQNKKRDSFVVIYLEFEKY